MTQPGYGSATGSGRPDRILAEHRLWVKQLDRRLVVELWLFPDGSRNLEISTKAKPAEAFQVAQDLRAYLRDIGIELTGNQQTKTRAAMEFFTPEVRQQVKKRRSLPKNATTRQGSAAQPRIS